MNSENKIKQQISPDDHKHVLVKCDELFKKFTTELDLEFKNINDIINKLDEKK